MSNNNQKTGLHFCLKELCKIRKIHNCFPFPDLRLISTWGLTPLKYIQQHIYNVQSQIWADLPNLFFSQADEVVEIFLSIFDSTEDNTPLSCDRNVNKENVKKVHGWLPLRCYMIGDQQMLITKSTKNALMGKSPVMFKLKLQNIDLKIRNSIQTIKFFLLCFLSGGKGHVNQEFQERHLPLNRSVFRI